MYVAEAFRMGERARVTGMCWIRSVRTAEALLAWLMDVEWRAVSLCGLRDDVETT